MEKGIIILTALRIACSIAGIALELSNPGAERNYLAMMLWMTLAADLIGDLLHLIT